MAVSVFYMKFVAQNIPDKCPILVFEYRGPFVGLSPPNST